MKIIQKLFWTLIIISKNKIKSKNSSNNNIALLCIACRNKNKYKANKVWMKYYKLMWFCVIKVTDKRNK